MWLTSNTPARVRTARCSLTRPPPSPAYSTGMSQPPNGTIFAPEARWRALSGVFLRGASVACSIARRIADVETGNGTMRFRAGSRIAVGLHRVSRPAPRPRKADGPPEPSARDTAEKDQREPDRNRNRKQRARSAAHRKQDHDHRERGTGGDRRRGDEPSLDPAVR